MIRQARGQTYTKEAKRLLHFNQAKLRRDVPINPQKQAITNAPPPASTIYLRKESLRKQTKQETKNPA